MKLKHVKRHLLECISSVVSHSQNFIHHPATAFSRTSPLDLHTMIYALLAMGGNSLSKELLNLTLPVSTSAFVQRRYQIKPQAFYHIFKEFTARIPLANSLPILAVDGSDVCIPRNRLDAGTLVQNSPDSTPYNLIHINALYDITNGIYHDLLIQDKRNQDERAAFLDMMENSPFRTSSRYPRQRI